MNSPLRRGAGSSGGVVSHFPSVAAAPGPLAPIKGSPTKVVGVLANVSEMAATPSGGGMVQWRNAGGSAAAAAATMDWNHPSQQRAMTLPEFGSTLSDKFFFPFGLGIAESAIYNLHYVVCTCCNALLMFDYLSLQPRLLSRCAGRTLITDSTEAKRRC